MTLNEINKVKDGESCLIKAKSDTAAQEAAMKTEVGDCNTRHKSDTGVDEAAKMSSESTASELSI